MSRGRYASQPLSLASGRQLGRIARLGPLPVEKPTRVDIELGSRQREEDPAERAWVAVVTLHAVASMDGPSLLDERHCATRPEAAQHP